MRKLFSLNTKNMNPVRTGLACESVGHTTKKSKHLRFESTSKTGTLYFPILQKMFKILLHYRNFFLVACWYKFNKYLDISTLIDVFPFAKHLTCTKYNINQLWRTYFDSIFFI